MNPAMSRMLVAVEAGHFVDVPFASYSQEAAIAAYAGWRAPQWANPSVVRTMERFGYAQYDVIATRFFGRSSTRGVGNQAFRSTGTRASSRMATSVAASAATRAATRSAIRSSALRVGVRAIPYLGWALLAYDVYRLADDML